MRALADFVEGIKPGPRSTAFVYRLWLDLIRVPGIVRTLRRVAATQSAASGVAGDCGDYHFAGEEAYHQKALYDVLGQLDEIDRSLDGKPRRDLESLFSEGKVWLVVSSNPDLHYSQPGWGLGSSYQCATDVIHNIGYIMMHSITRLMAARLRQRTCEMLGLVEAAAATESCSREWSCFIWRCAPTALSMKPLLATDFSGALLLSYEAGDADERRHVLAWLKEVESARPNGKPAQWTDESMLRLSRLMLGRLP